MHRDKTAWSLVSLGAALAVAAVAFIVWHDLWPAVIESHIGCNLSGAKTAYARGGWS
jgi:hypothetical protein